MFFQLSTHLVPLILTRERNRKYSPKTTKNRIMASWSASANTLRMMLPGMIANRRDARSPARLPKAARVSMYTGMQVSAPQNAVENRRV